MAHKERGAIAKCKCSLRVDEVHVHGGAMDVVPYMVCDLCVVNNVAQFNVCNRCCAINLGNPFSAFCVVQPARCNSWCAIYVVQSM
eukprot:4522403-Pyramimonas_sp.AAC.1